VLRDSSRTDWTFPKHALLERGHRAVQNGKPEDREDGEDDGEGEQLGKGAKLRDRAFREG